MNVLPMFSRAKLEPGTELYKEYYSRHPEHLAKDNLFREQAGLLQKGSIYFNPVLFASAQASFFTVNSLKPVVDGEPMESKTEIDIK